MSWGSAATTPRRARGAAALGATQPLQPAPPQQRLPASLISTTPPPAGGTGVAESAARGRRAGAVAGAAGRVHAHVQLSPDLASRVQQELTLSPQVGAGANQSGMVTVWARLAAVEDQLRRRACDDTVGADPTERSLNERLARVRALMEEVDAKQVGGHGTLGGRRGGGRWGCPPL